MAHTSPFDYIKSINTKTDKLDIDSGYVPFVVNRGLSYTIDTVLFANECNINNHIDATMQYDFYYHGIPKKKRYGKWIKKESFADVTIIQESYKCSITRAIEYSNILTTDQIALLKERLGRGGHVQSERNG